ncbi:hypothetical protein DIPPA_04393 [Diplonema papillatum]|nr:hypothetical protein DIPPA_04393 [Diplonema papillatum]
MAGGPGRPQANRNPARPENDDDAGISQAARDIVADVLAEWNAHRTIHGEEPLTPVCVRETSALDVRKAKWNGVGTPDEIAAALRQYEAHGSVTSDDLSIACTLLVKATPAGGGQDSADARAFVRRFVAKQARASPHLGHSNVATLLQAYAKLSWSKEREGLKHMTSPQKLRSWSNTDYGKLISSLVQMRDLSDLKHHLLAPRGADGASRLTAALGERLRTFDLRDVATVMQALGALRSLAGEMTTAADAVQKLGFSAGSPKDAALVLWAASRARVKKEHPVYQCVMERFAAAFVDAADLPLALWSAANARVAAPGFFAHAVSYAAAAMPSASSLDAAQYLWSFAASRILAPPLFQQRLPASVAILLPGQTAAHRNVRGAVAAKHLSTMIWAYSQAASKAHVETLDRIIASLCTRPGMNIPIPPDTVAIAAVAAVTVNIERPRVLDIPLARNLSRLPPRGLAELGVAAKKARNHRVLHNLEQMYVARPAALDQANHQDLVALRSVFNGRNSSTGSGPTLERLIARKLLKR